MNQIIDERRTNWFWIDNEVVDRFGPQIGAYGLAVYAALARFADGHTRIAFPAIPTIATQLSVHRST
ncbi:MAG: helix-turn-helix domain-containing protein, partial [Anaerolineae bacterium]